MGQARMIVDAAHQEAEKRGLTMAFAVAIPSGEPILLEVMDGTQMGSIPLAASKAKTAARYRRPTKAFSEDFAGKAAMSYTSVPESCRWRAASRYC
ncbi:heme-binding protein [Sphingobium sp. LSP13-1-1.1]|uniref:heme-binding protein n=1 Tax=Sphingobium sp. LSP13-1-1.1 TaxID=3135234 RepID=UPI0034435F9D